MSARNRRENLDEQAQTRGCSSDRPAARSVRRKRWLVNLGLFAGGSLVALIGAEIVLRLIFYFPQLQFLRPDAICGHRLRPNIRGYYVEEGFSHYATNSAGWRDSERSVEKPAGIFRIAVLGDSYAEALQVELEQTFVKQLEMRLKAAEVLNFGASGFATAQELLAYRHYVRPYRPDLVVLTVCPGNDIADNSKELSGDYPRPYFAVKDGRLELDNTFRQSRRHRFLRQFGGLYYSLTDHSALAQSLNHLRRGIAQRYRQTSGARQRTSPTIDAGLTPGIFGPPANELWREAWEITERLIAELCKSVRDDGSSLVIMTVTLAAQVDPQSREQTARDRPGIDLDYADRRIQQFAEKIGVPCLVLAPGFLKYAEKTGRRLHGFGAASRGHWNSEGHRLAAESLYRFLVERRLVPPEPDKGRRE